MRPEIFSRMFVFMAWLLVACAAGGTYLGHDRNIALFVLLVNTVVLTGVISGADRAERNCTCHDQEVS